jgi:hypothetical protein
MPTGHGAYKHGHAETAAVTKVLRSIEHRGLSTPCSRPDVRDWWLSEEPGERHRAAQWCLICPVITECREAASARREMFGVFGAVDFTRNPTARKG